MYLLAIIFINSASDEFDGRLRSSIYFRIEVTQEGGVVLTTTSIVFPRDSILCVFLDKGMLNPRNYYEKYL